MTSEALIRHDCRIRAVLVLGGARSIGFAIASAFAAAGADVHLAGTRERTMPSTWRCATARWVDRPHY